MRNFVQIPNFPYISKYGLPEKVEIVDNMTSFGIKITGDGSVVVLEDLGFTMLIIPPVF